ncbi:IS481 family transposase, partial [Mycobacterium sp. NPDC003323]
QFPQAPSPVDLPANTVIRTVSSIGNIGLDSVTYRVDAQRAFQQVLVVSVDDKVIVTDLDGEVLVEHTRPATGVKYVGNGQPRGPRPKPR